MFLYWAVLSLLLLLRHSINGESDVGKYRGRKSEDNPIEKSCSDSAEKICTTILYGPSFCKTVDYIDGRLLLTAAMMLQVDASGHIEKRYLNPITADWFRHYLNDSPGGYVGFIFDIMFVGNTAQAWIEDAKLTDVILYMGSDHAVNYDPPTYAYNSSLLQLKKGSILTDPYKHGPVQFCTFFKQKKAFAQIVDNGGSHSNWVSEPGIYRINLATGRMNELNYDPSNPSVTHLT